MQSKESETTIENNSRRRRRLRQRREISNCDSNCDSNARLMKLVLSILTMMIACNIMLTRRNALWMIKAMQLRVQPAQVQALSTLSSVQRSSTSLQSGSSIQQRCRIQGQHTYHRNNNHHPLAVSVSPPEITSEEAEEYPFEEYSQQPSEADSNAKQEYLLKDLNPSQVEAVTQPLFLNDQAQSSIVTRVIAGPGSGKTKVLTTRIAHLLHNDPYGKILAVTFTRKAAGEMKERLEKLLLEQEQVLETQQPELYDNDAVVQEKSQEPGVVDVEGSRNPTGIERVELGTFHSICAKILRYNGDLLRDLPSVQRDMSKAQPTWVEKIAPNDNNANDDNDDDESEPEMVLVDPEINLNGQYAIIDQTEQIRTLNECLKEQDIDLKATELKPIQILTAIGNMKEMFAQGKDPFTDQRKKNGSSGGAGAALRVARKIYYKYREKLLANNALDFDDLILLTRELLTVNDDLRERLHKRWPHVLVDEYQDTSKIQMDLIKLLTSKSLFVVGDADQSIYSWRGAHVGSLQDVATEFQSYGTVRTVFLKENYRSTSNIVRAAEKVISSGGGPKSVLSEAMDEAGESDAKLQALENKLTGNTDSNEQADDLRRAMKPKRGSGPSPRVVACEDERAEAKFVVDTILNMTAHGDLSSSDTVALIYRTNAQSRYLEEACVQQNLPYVIRGGAGGFYKRAEIRDCLCFLKWLYNGNDDGSMMRAMKTPSKGIGEKAFSEFKEYVEKVQSYIRQNCPDHEKPTYLDILISISSSIDGDGNNDVGSYVLPEGAPLPQDFITKRALNNFLKFSAKMKLIRNRAYNLNIGKLLFFVIEELELMGHFDSISKSRSEFLERKENVQELRNAAKKYASYGPSLVPKDSKRGDEEDDDDVMGVDSALASFLDDVALVSDIAEADQEDENNRMVANLMTIHASKGMEFDCVFVVGLEEGTLPCQPALQEGPGSVQLEEEKRLCYVAMTRAKTRLLLTWRKEVTSFSNWSDSGPKTQTKDRSRFLNAIVSKKSLKKGKKKKKKITQDASGAVRNASTYSGANQRYNNGRTSLNRSGLNGPGQVARRRSEPPRRQVSRASAPPLRRAEPQRPFSPSRRPLSTSTSRRTSKPPVTPSIEGIEALRSSLEESPSPSMPKRSPPKKRTPPAKSRTQRPRTSSPSASKDSVDPMWFFPVGKKVVHMNLGKGTVVEPPPFRTIEDAKVRVQFENGRTMEFPALGSDILPDMGNNF